MNPAERCFQDPLLAEVQQVLAKDTGTSWSLLLARLAVELHHARQRSGSTLFSYQEDPVLASVNRVFREEKVQLYWEKIIYLGCSAGGDVALRTLFGYINYPHVPVVIAMHHNPGFRFLARLELANGVTHTPVHVETDMPIRGGEIYFLPGDKWIGYNPSNPSFQLAPLTGKQRFRPLIDQVFSTAGQRFGRQVAGIILSGMLNDGAQGLKDVFLNHGETWIQDPAAAAFDDMPRAAQTAVPVAKIMTLKGIADRINAHSRQYLMPRSYKSSFHALPLGPWQKPPTSRMFTKPILMTVRRFRTFSKTAAWWWLPGFFATKHSLNSWRKW